ncbi:hypothetical protein P691DRAFT_738538 [Macrolepiota fuliginosa MF-IS2]|uniref:F-box domain-containing protein n=1 Tax=Macrolepiota fuliginosa MF-IS2 TaxID=1400762 RepID=A0A9P5X3T1_9AGAR|nr:hypothetical protein P691DRAFT_738538 [Macrolepiota fuliginosa MF-IS2]
MAAFVATSSPKEQEALEVNVAQQQDALQLQEMRKVRQIAKGSSTATIIEPVGLTLPNLPLEILTHTLLHLPFNSVVICQRVNRHLHILISESTELQYHIHLGISGLVDNPRCGLSVAERLSRLLARERRWEELDFDFHKVINITFPLRATMTTLSAGVFGGTATGKCRYMRIPSAATEEVKWREVHTEQTTVSRPPGFHEPDLHVLITAQPQTVHTDATKSSTVYDVRVHFNQLSTGEPHPDVRRATISFETCREFEDPKIFMRCARDNIVLVLQDYGERNKPEDQVLVYEWRTGELKLSFSAPWGSYYHPMFLTTHLFLLPNTATGNLEYWRIPQSPSEPTPSQPFFLLSLPRLCLGNTFRYIMCSAEPNVGPCSASKPFYSSPEHAIAVFYVHILSAGLGTAFRLFVHRSSLIGRLDQFSAFISFDKPPEPVPYDQWGPPVCQWFHNDPGKWSESTFGQKYIVPPPPAGKGAPLALLDFNPIDVAKVLAEENHLQATTLGEGGWARVEENYRAEVVLSGDHAENGSGYEEKDVIETCEQPCGPRPQPRAVTRTMDPLNDPEGCFAHTVYSSLPYTVRSSQDEYRYDDFLLDEESIIGIQMDDEENVKEIRVLHYG